MTLRLLALLAISGGCSPSGGEQHDRRVRFDLSAPDARESAELIAMDHLGKATWRRGVEDFVAYRTEIDRLGVSHTRVQQLLGGVPVFGGGGIVHVPVDGRQIRTTDGFLRGLSVDTRPERTQQDALDFVRRTYEAPIDRIEADLQVLRRPGGDYLAWRVQVWSLSGEQPEMPVIFVDAHRSGGEIWRYDNLQTALDRDTHDCNNGTTLPGTLVRDEGEVAIGDAAADDAHDFAKTTYDYYDQFQDRDSFDDAGATITSSVHYASSYPNAFWTGFQMGYGDGDGTFTTHFSASLDVVAHELTHAVTQWTAGLLYFDQSGGLNEATSDIMGAVVESWDDGWVVSDATWELGEDVVIGSGAFRYMDDPTSDGRSIDDFDDYYDGINVHFSSGIANKAFSEWVDDPEVTIEEGGDIWYRALRYYMTANTTFEQGRRATEQAAIDLFGEFSDEHEAVRDGRDVVDLEEGLRYSVEQTWTNIQLADRAQATYTFTPSGDAEAVRFTLELSNGATGDGDLYVRFGTAPTLSLYDCGSLSPDGFEICEFDPSFDGDYHVLVDAWTAITGGQGATLKAWEGVSCEDADGDGITNCDGDCDDDNAEVSPNAHEICNDIDDDCDGTVDGPTAVDAETWFRDADQDGYGNPAVSIVDCEAPPLHVLDGTDCDDANEGVNPGADEVCDDDDVDEDCDGEAEEEDALDTIVVMVDADGDGYGNDEELVVTCQLADGLSDLPGDCDDDDEDVHPGAFEDCDDRRDTNCDGSSGADDLDRDGVQACDDCDDRMAERAPGLDEICDGIDNDCNGVVDDDAVDARVWFEDKDGDGFGSSVRIEACFDDGASTISGDCDDDAKGIYPGAPDSDDDDIDQNCDGAEDGGSSLLSTCGCASTTGPAPALPVVVLLGLLALRRRR